MENNKRIVLFRNPLYCAKEEVKELRRLLKEAERRLNVEYKKTGGQSWGDYLNDWYMWVFNY
tara:strand:- start:3996 stop:4181 length:186 start_codon:yes stop_codon:yes gene_type:complete